MKEATRKELLNILGEWQKGVRSTREVHEWAVARYAVPEWEAEYEVANQVLAELDMLYVNLIIVEDIPIIQKVLSSPSSLCQQSLSELEEYHKSIDITRRKHELVVNPFYARYCK
jgi:hypothetical protein